MVSDSGILPAAQAAGATRPRLCVLSLSRIADDPRVRRQGDAFHHAGWAVIGVGLPGAASHPPAWAVRGGSPGEPAAAPPPWRRWRRGFGGLQSLFAVARLAARPLVRGIRATRLLLVRLYPPLAYRIYWSWPLVRQLYARAGDVSADVWLANDWSSLPLAERLARERGGIYGYDTHELAVEEYAEKWRWRVFQRPVVRALEGRFIGGAAVVSAVSSGIAAYLAGLYDLASPPIAIRNVPSLAAVAPRPTGARVRVLYHGILAPGRGLEAAIDSVARWRGEFDLTIRGPAAPDYLKALKGRIDKEGLAGRISLAPPVPMVDLVKEAAPFDVGFFALPGHSGHNVFALPNKFFEYAMAGLALCISDLPEMTRLVRQYDMGVTIAAVTPAAIAAAINSLDRAAIDRFRSNALRAARELCWEKESERLVSAYRQALGLAPAPREAAVS